MKLVEMLMGLRFPLKINGLKAKTLAVFGMEVNQCARIGCINVRGPKLVVGDSWLGDYGYYIGSVDTAVIIEDNVDIGPNVKFYTGSHEIGEHERRAGIGFGKDIRVCSGVWIGANSTILGGVQIGSGSIIASGSVVIHDVPKDTLVAGNPAQVKRKLS